MGKAASALRSQETALKVANEVAVDAMKLSNVTAVFLVGSRARGDYRADSDVDIAVVVKGRLDFEGRLSIMRALHRPGIDILVFDEDWWCGDSPIARELRREAVRLAGSVRC